MSGKYFQTINGKKVDLDVKYKGFPWDEKAGEFYEGWGATKYSPKDSWVETLETQYTYNEDQKVTVIKPGTHPTFYIKDTISTDVTKTFKDTKAWVNCSGGNYSLVTVRKGTDNEKKECLKINYYTTKEDKTPAKTTNLYAGDFQDNVLPTRLLVLLQGAGGGGGGGTSHAWSTKRGAGGGSGGYWFGIIRFDDTISKIEVELGNGGIGGRQEKNGENGATTILKVYRNNLQSLIPVEIVTLFGGKGGTYNGKAGEGGTIDIDDTASYGEVDNTLSLGWTLGYGIGKAGGKKNKKGTDFSETNIKLSCTRRSDLKEEICYQTYLSCGKSIGGAGSSGGGGGASLLSNGGDGGTDGHGTTVRRGRRGYSGAGGGGGGDYPTFRAGWGEWIGAALFETDPYKKTWKYIEAVRADSCYTLGGAGGDAIFVLWA